MAPDDLGRSQQVVNNEINLRVFEGDTLMALMNDSRPGAQGREKHLSTDKTTHYKLSVASTRLPLLLNCTCIDKVSFCTCSKMLTS